MHGAPVPAPQERETADRVATPRLATPSPLPPRTEVLASVARRLSPLDRVTCDGKPLRTMCVRDAREWAAVNGRRARFVDLVTSNMPGNWIIGEHCPDDLADELWQRTEREHAV